MSTIRVADLRKYEFQKAVITKGLLTPPLSPSAGDRYLINGVGTGDWVGYDYDIATYTGTVWEFTENRPGMLTWVTDEAKYYLYDGSAWDGDFVHEHANKALLDSYTQSESDLADAVSKKHTQNTDTILDSGGANEISAAQAKEAYTKRAVYNVALETIDFEL